MKPYHSARVFLSKKGTAEKKPAFVSENKTTRLFGAPSPPMLTAAYANDPSPRKEETTGLVVSLVVDEDQETPHRAAAVEVRPDDTHMTWETRHLGKLPRFKGGLTPRGSQIPAFALSGVTMMSRFQLQFNVWFTGARYTMRWFQAEFSISDLKVPYLNDVRKPTHMHPALTRQTSGPLPGPEWYTNSLKDPNVRDPLEHVPIENHSFEVLHGRGRVTLAYAAVHYYHAIEGEIAHLQVHRIDLELLDPGLFRRFLSYRGHRLTCAVGHDYLYRANVIDDTLPVKFDSVGMSRVESTRQRSSEPSSYDSSTGDAPPQPPPHRVYQWKSREMWDAPFPSVRDGHKPSGPEEILDRACIAKTLGVAPPKTAENIVKSQSEGELLRRSPRVQSWQKHYVPDNPDFSNTRFRLPRPFRKTESPLLIHLFDFRTTPPRHRAVAVSWMDLDQDIVRELPDEMRTPSPKEREDPEPAVAVNSRRWSPRSAFQRRRSSRSLRTSSSLAERRRSVPTKNSVRTSNGSIIPTLSFLTSPRVRKAVMDTKAEEVEEEAQKTRRGVVTKWISPEVRLDVHYATRPRCGTVVDIEKIVLAVTDFDKTLNSAALWTGLAQQ
jgi:hypothetical protein